MASAERDHLERLRRRFERVARRLSRASLRSLADPDALLSEEDLDPRSWRTDGYFLGFYSAHGLERALEAYGIFARLEAMGWRDLRIELDLPDRTDQRLRLFGSGHGRRDAVLAELIAHEGEIEMPPLGAPAAALHERACATSYAVIVLEWMLLQAPGRPFRPDRPRLPGQRWPGLGIGAEVLELVYRMGKRLERDGVIAFPAYYHNAVLYRARFRFVSPEDEGRMLAYARDLAPLTLAQASWAFELGCVRDRHSGEPVHWRGPELCMPLAPPLERRFAEPAYWARVREAAERCRVCVDMALFDRRKAEEEAAFARRIAAERQAGREAQGGQEEDQG